MWCFILCILLHTFDLCSTNSMHHKQCSILLLIDHIGGFITWYLTKLSQSSTGSLGEQEQGGRNNNEDNLKTPQVVIAMFLLMCSFLSFIFSSIVHFLCSIDSAIPMACMGNLIFLFIPMNIKQHFCAILFNFILIFCKNVWNIMEWITQYRMKVLFFVSYAIFYVVNHEWKTETHCTLKLNNSFEFQYMQWFKQLQKWIEIFSP